LEDSVEEVWAAELLAMVELGCFMGFLPLPLPSLEILHCVSIRLEL
jgi:hypothetical protein